MRLFEKNENETIDSPTPRNDTQKYLIATFTTLSWSSDQGYGRGDTPIFTGVFEPLARVALYPTD